MEAVTNVSTKDILNTLEKFWDSTSSPLPTRFLEKVNKTV